MIQAPKYDRRTARDVARELEELLGLDRLSPDQLAGRFDAALVQVFSRFGELVIERLNKAPGKNFLAFLDLLGVSQLPMEAAVVPLTFLLAPGTSDHAIVRAGTQVAAPPGKGSQKPVVFETETELVVTSARLDSIYTKDGERDQYADLSAAAVTDGVAPQVGAVEQKPTPIPHAFYVAVPTSPNWPSLDELRLEFALDQTQRTAGDPWSLQWETSAVPVGAEAGAAPTIQILTPDGDDTRALTQSGAVVFRNLPQISPTLVDGQTAQWLACRLLTPITSSSEPKEGTVRQSQSPVIQDLTIQMAAVRSGLPVDLAFYEKAKLDVTKDFFPFGERPKLGDTLYLGSREVFSNPDAAITLQIQLSNSSGAASNAGIPPARANNVELCWEFWEGKKWAALHAVGRRLRLSSEGDDVAAEFEDHTQSLTQTGSVSFRFPKAPAELNLNGQKNYWIRVRIAGGDYGRDVQVQRNEGGGLSTTPSTLAPPSIRTLKLDYELKKEAKPRILLYNDFEYVQVPAQSKFQPFRAVSGSRGCSSLYYGFSVGTPAKGTTPSSNVASQGSRGFPRLPVSTYVVLAGRSRQESSPATGNTATVWEYWNGNAWKQFTVADRTQGMRKSGLMQFLVPGEFAGSQEFGKHRYWLRMRLESKASAPPIASVLLNTTTAIQGITVSNDLLGSSSGEPGQRFRTTQPFVLSGQILEVREPTLPPVQEQEQLRRDSEPNQDPIRLTTESAGKHEYWIRWREVDSFHASTSRDRHYLIDRPKGEVLFGDGVCGLIPPVLPGNIRMTRYRSGGGRAGDQSAQAIKQLVSAVPYIQKVVNWLPARGGNDPEEMDTILQRGAREIRHHRRAVTAEDFEDLALLASREVARAKCVPRCDLASDPSARYRRPGSVSVIVVPQSADRRPVPDSDLLDRVHTFLDSRRLPTAGLTVVGPQFVRVDVETEVVVERLDAASEVEQQVTKALENYLHPIGGGTNRLGWEFGRLPQKFDLYVLIERVPGVSHIRNLNMSAVAESPDLEKTGHFLIHCGHLKITMTL